MVASFTFNSYFGPATEMLALSFLLPLRKDEQWFRSFVFFGFGSELSTWVIAGGFKIAKPFYLAVYGGIKRFF